MKTILLVVVIDAHFTELVRVARMVQQAGKYKPVILFTYDYQNRQRDIATCQREQIECLDDEANLISSAPAPSAAPASSPVPKRGLAERLPVELYVGAFAFPLWLFGHHSQVRKARRIIDRVRPALMVFAEENPGYFTAAFIGAGHDRKIASLIVPYTVVTRLEPAEAFFDIPYHAVSGVGNRLVARLFPQWVHVHRERKLLRLPAGHILAMEALRLAPPDPWTYLSGFADAIAVESDEMEHHYEREGLPKDRLVRTGALYDDVLARNRDEALENRRVVLKDAGLADDKPLVLCALPPDQYSFDRPGREFADQRALLEFLVDAFESVPANVIYRLHPRTPAGDAGLLRERGATIAAPRKGRAVTIVDQDTAALVPLCDVFVASVSATIRWAIACGKPVINFDMHRYRYHDYDAAHGVVTIEDKAEFLSVLRDVISNKARYAELAARQAEAAPHWAKLDGKAATRMSQLIDRLIEENQ